MNADGRLTDRMSSNNEDASLDITLRPRSLDEYIGQTAIKESLNIFLQAAKQRGESLEHVLLYGPPGLGKTTLAHIIGSEMGANVRVTSGPAIERAGDLAAILSNLEQGDVLFIDEIHRLNRVVEEVLYPALEDFQLDVVIGKGPAARTLRLPLPRFTVIGATTKYHLLSSPLRDRFGVTWHLDFYQPEEIQRIVNRSGSILQINVTNEAAREIALRSRATPRVANRLLKRVRDFAQVKGHDVVDEAAAQAALAQLSIDQFGLDTLDRRLLQVIAEKFKGGPVGISSLAAATSEDEGTIEDIYEPYLMQLGFLTRTPRGRVVTEAGYRHLGINPPVDLQAKML